MIPSKSKFNIAVENKKRKREVLLVIPLGIAFLILIWIELRLFSMSQSLPFVHSIFFFGLVNFNIVLFLLMMFLLFRNIVKVFLEKKSGLFGSSLKAKLSIAFIAFSLLPTALMFIVSVFYINNSFDKWFSDKITGVLKSSLEVTSAYHLSTKKKNYHFARQIAEQLEDFEDKDEILKILSSLRESYSLDVVEYYSDLKGSRVISLDSNELIPDVPNVDSKLIEKVMRQKSEASTIHQVERGNLVRVAVPSLSHKTSGAVVVTSYVPISLLAQMDDIAMTYGDLKDAGSIESPLKSIYIIILVLMTLVILFGATWFGFYMAKQISIPLEELGRASRRIASKEYLQVKAISGASEVNELIQNFNSMTAELERSEREVLRAHQDLDERSRYISVVLSNAKAGVISTNLDGKVTMFNRYAAEILSVEPGDFLEKKLASILAHLKDPALKEIFQFLDSDHRAMMRKEIRFQLDGRSMLLQMTLSVLFDDQKKPFGKVLVFDDLTPTVRAQRAAAWAEVAKRIAHEIKNPLTPIKLAAERLQKKFGSAIGDPAFNECTTMIISQVDDLKSLVNEFSQFARMPQTNPTLSDLNQAISDVLVLYRAAHRHIEFNFQPDGELPVFWFDQDKIKRAISNLIDNAISAVSEETTPQIVIQTLFDSHLQMVTISVADNGVGADSQLRERMFEPYVTHKKDGTGLGLAIVKKSIEDHNGFVRAVANLPKGLKMIVELPVVMNRSQIAEAKPDVLGLTEDHNKGNLL